MGTLNDRIDRRDPDPKVVPIKERREPERVPAWVARLPKNAKDLTGRAA